MALGAVHVIVLVPFTVSVVTVGADGVAGIVEGVTELLADDCGVQPFALWALTVYVYDVPSVPPESDKVNALSEPK